MKQKQWTGGTPATSPVVATDAQASVGDARDRAGPEAENAGLVATLRAADEHPHDPGTGRLESSVADDRRSLLSRRAQDESRHDEAARQAAIIDALPANIAMLDHSGLITSVNAQWRRFARDNASYAHAPGHGVGHNYLQVCERTEGAEAEDAQRAAAGIRGVLAGRADSFSIEYPCHSPTEQRWFVMTATPLPGPTQMGAVVMHVEVTAERLAQSALRDSELRFRQMAESIGDVFFLKDARSNQLLYVSPAYEEIWGRSRASAYADVDSWVDAIHPEDRAASREKYRKLKGAGGYQDSFRILRPNGSMRWIEAESFPVHDAEGRTIRMAGVAKDVTVRREAELDLLESQRRFSSMLDNLQLAAVRLDSQGRITYCNDYLLQLSGWRLEEVIGRDWFEVFMPAVLGDIRPVFEALLDDSPDAWHRENEIFTRAGDRRLLRWNNSVLRSGSGEVIGVASIGEDVTEARAAEDGIRRLARVHAMLSGINSLMIRVRNRDELFRDACRIAVGEGRFPMAWIGVIDAAKHALVAVASEGAETGYLDEIKHRLLLADDASAGYAPAALAARSGEPVIVNDITNDRRVVLKQAHTRRGIHSLVSLPLLIADKPVAVLTLHAGEADHFDAAEIRLLRDLAADLAFAVDHLEKQERLDYLAYYDALTGLANRSLFLERLAQRVLAAGAVGQRLAVCVIDLERFKNINDNLGQAAGDALLRQVSEWLVRSTGDASALARIGADHFAVMLPAVRHRGTAARLINRSMDRFMRHPFHLEGAMLRIAAKVGVSVFPDDGSDAGLLFRNAEAALIQGKASGERCVFYVRAMAERMVGQLTLETRLRLALENEEFVLHYQPKVHLRSGKLTGAEALIRWNDPVNGLVPPAQFIPVLEETGLIQEVGRWALHKAIADYLTWCDAGLPAVRIAVNVSPLQLRKRGFVSEVSRAIAVDARAGAALELEITESVIMEDIHNSIVTLQALRNAGLPIAIDDFGTGFSSLSYLSQLPVDTLKIDRSFVVGMQASRTGEALLSTIVQLAHSLDLNTVAEGVETEEQAGLLRTLGCDEMQGFLYGRPVPRDQFEAIHLARGPG